MSVNPINFRYRLSLSKRSVLTGASMCLPNGDVVMAAGADQGHVCVVAKWMDGDPTVRRVKVKMESDVCAQVWNNEGVLLYSGFRNGSIHVIDTRTDSSQHIPSSVYGSSVCDLRRISASQLLVTRMDGTMGMMDVRFKGVVG
ncbi:hypothetical protein BC829DRAFT_202353 [Chytridium lagenaria]|nr:hypothetical protein BC829DRAFT_202353 [Chytridium lagenaria]